MTVIKVALVQLDAAETLDETLHRGLWACREAAAHGADIALFPEMWSSGYRLGDLEDPGVRAAWQAGALALDHDFIMQHRALARDAGLAIGLTYLGAGSRGAEPLGAGAAERRPGGPRNAFCLIDRTGEVVLEYAKVHTCGHTMERFCGAGDAFRVATLETAKGPLAVGAMICFDREFPESARILALQGAELVLVPNACNLDAHRIAQMKTRAFENKIALAMTNYPAVHREANGRSLAIVPMAFAAGGEDNGQGAYRETLIMEAGPEEGVYYADFDLDEIRRYRKNAIWGDTFRRPDVYGALLEQRPLADFAPDVIVH